MARSIKITADTAQLRKSISDISKMVTKDLGKSKIELFTPDTKKFLRSEASAYASVLEKKIEGIKKSTEGHRNALKDVVKGSKQELDLKMRILKASQHIVDTEKEHQQVISATNDLQQSAFSKQFMKMSGLSTIMKGLKGIGGEGGGMLGMLGGALGAGSVAALAYGGSRVLAGRETWKQGVQDRLSLMGRGEFNLEPQRPGEMERAGLDAQQMRAQRLQAMDVFGREGATERQVVQKAGFERAFGVEQGTMTDIGAGLRPALGGKEANNTVMKLQAALISSGIKDAIGPYLETAASMLTELNEKGFTMDDSVLALFNQMAKTGMGEGQIKNITMGVDQAIRGSTGESNAFMQSVFHKAGIGGQSIGGMQAAMEMGGLFGADLSKFKGKITPEAEQLNKNLGVGRGDYTQKVSSSLLSQLKQSTGGQTGDQAELSKFRFMKNLGLAKNIGQAEMVEKMLQTAASPQTSVKERGNIMKQLQDIQDDNKDPNLSELKKINQSTAGTFDVLQKLKTTQLDLMGEVTGWHFNEVDKLLTSIDGGILALAKFFTGYESPEEQRAERENEVKEAQGIKKKAEMGEPLTRKEQEQLRDLPLKDRTEMYRDLKGKADVESQKGFFRNRSYEVTLQSEAMQEGQAHARVEDRQKAKQQVTSSVSPESKDAKQTNALLQRIHETLRGTERNTRNMTPIGSSSTTGTGQ